MSDRPLVLLVTCTAFPDGEPGYAALDPAFAAHGIDSRWVAWDDESVDWAAADAVAVRSTWDYEERVGEFLGWASGVGPALLNGVSVFRWNTDKRYLLDLGAAGLPIVPTVAADTVPEVRDAAREAGLAVVKPRVGAGGRGLEVIEEPTTWEPGETSRGPWIVQPLVESIHHDGETSVFVIGGHPVAQVDKLPSTTDIRVHEQFGGTSRPVTLDPGAALLATNAVAVTTELLAAELVYARVDLLRHRGRLVVSEIEVTEPGLYLDIQPENAVPFVEAVAAWIERRGR